MRGPWSYVLSDAAYAGDSAASIVTYIEASSKLRMARFIARGRLRALIRAAIAGAPHQGPH
jgi:dephospho-CoA kinase